MKKTEKIQRITTEIHAEIVKEKSGTFEIARLVSALYAEFPKDKNSLDWRKHCLEQFGFHDTRCWQFKSIHEFQSTLSKYKLGRSKLCLLGHFKKENRLKMFIKNHPDFETSTYRKLNDDYRKFQGKTETAHFLKKKEPTFQELTNQIIQRIESKDFNIFKNKKHIYELENAILKVKKSIQYKKSA